MPKFRCLAEWSCVVLLILCMAVAVSAQSNGIDPVLLAKAKAGNATAEYQVGFAYEYANPQDDAQAAVWFRKAAEQGLAEAQFSLGEFYDHGDGVTQDDAEAALWYRKASEQGYAPAQFFLGLDYDGGKGVPQNYTEAYFWLDVATSGNLKGIGQEDIAKWRDEAASHLTPTELSTVQERARKWFKTQSTDSTLTQSSDTLKKRAATGDAEAQYKLGVLYEDVGGLNPDYAQADVWFRKAAEQGLAEAQFYLGVSYDLGQGVPQDYSQAASWYRKAAEQGYASAQWNYGKLYDTGLGVPQDYAEAYLWLSIAATGKFEAPIMKDLATERDKVAAHLTPADLSRVQERVRKWFASHTPHKGGRL